MTKREIVFMCCRLIAVYIFMNSIISLSNSLSSFYFGGFSISSTGNSALTTLSINFNGVPATNIQIASFLLFRLAPTLLNWFAAVLFWIGAREVSIRLFENVPEEIEAGPKFTIGTDVREVAFGCLGLLFLSQDLPVLLTWLLSQLWSIVSWTSTMPYAGNFYFSWLILMRVILSIWLIFGLRGLVGLWRLAQEKGITPTRRSAQ